LAALIDVVDDKCNRGAGRDLAALLIAKDAREDAHAVGLAALRGEARLPGPSLVEKALDVGGLERDARRAAVDDTADRWSVAFAPGRNPKQVPKGVVRHRLWLLAPRRLFTGTMARMQRRRGEIARVSHVRGRKRTGPPFNPANEYRVLCATSRG